MLLKDRVRLSPGFAKASGSLALFETRLISLRKGGSVSRLMEVVDVTGVASFPVKSLTEML